MEKLLWKGRIRPGMREEYIRRHDEIWPEMEEALRAAGIRNYSIWNCGDELIGYYECPSVEFALRFQDESEAVQRWSASMQHVMEMVRDLATGEKLTWQKVYELD